MKKERRENNLSYILYINTISDVIDIPIILYVSCGRASTVLLLEIVFIHKKVEFILFFIKHMFIVIANTLQSRYGLLEYDNFINIRSRRTEIYEN